MGGTLKSWALPKGLVHYGEKHLAVQVEDRAVRMPILKAPFRKGNMAAAL